MLGLEEMLPSFLMALAGFVGGILAGLLGIGGGVIYVFVLSIFLKDQSISDTELPRFLIANSVFATFFAGLSSSIKNRLYRSFSFRDVLYVAIPGVIFSLAFTYLITYGDWYSKKDFAWFFSLLLLLFFVKLFRKPKPGKSTALEKKPLALSVVGVFAGLVSALSGLGGGVIMIPLLNGYFKLSMQKAAAISLAVIPFMALSMVLFYLFGTVDPKAHWPGTVGYIVFPAAIPLVVGVFLGAPLGVKVAKNLPQRVIKIIFALLLVVVALKLILS